MATRHGRSAEMGRAAGWAAVLLAACTLGGCMPKQFEVRAGTDPAYIDTDVRFRTIYYFRVFDYCGELYPDSSRVKILNDSLYRFRMTGKANSATNKVRFESGTLRAPEIDPFGSDVEFDQESGRFRYKSRARTEEETTRREAFEDIQALLVLYDSSLSKFNQGADFKDDLKSLVQQRLNRLSYANGTDNQNKQKSLDPDQLKAADEKPGNQGAALDSPTNPLSKATPTGYCAADNARRGYQIFGPEGWRTFDQDERLLLAMSSSGQPLIDTLREVSDRVLQDKQNGRTDTMLLREQLRIRNAQRALDSQPSKSDPKAALDAALKAFAK
jgi:hypothetical protein